MQLVVSPLELDMTVKVVIAGFFGMLIGLERQGGATGAGLRTFSLITMGSTLFTVLSVESFPAANDPMRLAASIVTGIGFIGAGVIWRQKEEAIHGITTAAAIWVAAGIGIAVGLGYFVLSTMITLATMIILARGHVVKVAKGTFKKELIGIES
ncbi:MAG: MgtC/SapB family protein [Candidatus Altiarchaeota archaeon]